MDDVISRKADYATFPFGSATSGVGIANVQGITAAGNFAIPAYWIGKNLRVYAIGNDFQVSVTAAAQTLVYNQASPPGSEVATAGWPLPNGTFTPDGIVIEGAGFFNYVPASATAGKLFFVITEPANV